MIRPYRVFFDTYRNRIASSWEVDIMTHNMKEAKAMAEDLWYEKMGNESHMFHIKVRKIKEMEYNEPKETSRTRYNWGNHGYM